MIINLKSLHQANKKSLLRVALICAFGVMLAACAGTDAPAALPPDNPPAAPPQSGSLPSESLIDLKIDCDVSGIHYLDDYVQDEADATSLLCRFRWQGGTPSYDISYTLGPISGGFTEITKGERLPDSGRTEYRFLILPPVMPPGRHELYVEVTDSAGEMAEAVSYISWSWRSGSANLISVDFIEPESNAVTINLGEKLKSSALVFALGFDNGIVETTLASEKAALAYDFLSGSVTAEWDFGDGVKQTERITPKPAYETSDYRFRQIDSSLAQNHTYKKPGTYEVTLTVKDERYDRIGSATLRVLVESPTVPPTEVESAAVPDAAAWVLVESPEVREVDRSGGQRNVFTISEESISSRYRQFLNGEATSDWAFTFTYGLLPGLLIPGQSVTLNVSGTTSCEGDDPYTPEQSFGFFYNVFGSSHVDLSPAEPIVIDCRPGGNRSDSGSYSFVAPNGKPGDQLTLLGQAIGFQVRWVYQLPQSR